MSAGASAGAAAAAAAAEQKREEEEELTRYDQRDLEEGWEFKILRSNMGAFGNPERLRAALTDQSAAGWTLVEKFDNYRIRLKRPASARQQDDKLDFDPYRTTIGMAEGPLALTIIAIIFAVLFAVIGLIFLMRR